MTPSQAMLATLAKYNSDQSTLNHAEPTAVYIYSDAGGNALYVGVTRNQRDRHAEHKRSKTWSDKVATRDVFICATRRGALDAEAILIRLLKPKFNIMHNGKSHEPDQQTDNAET